MDNSAHLHWDHLCLPAGVLATGCPPVKEDAATHLAIRLIIAQTMA
jgi:hypothetical protein